jgi:hypothetical protein
MADSQRIEDLRRRVEKDPASIAFAQLAEEFRRAGQLQESVAVCRAGLAIHPGYLSARVTLGRAFLELNQLAEAQAELSQVLKSAPENLAAIRGLAEVHHRGGDLAEALVQYRAALSLARNDPDLEQTVSDLTRKLAPKGASRGSDGLSFEQMQRELSINPQAQRPPAPEPPPAPVQPEPLPAPVDVAPSPAAPPAVEPEPSRADLEVATSQAWIDIVEAPEPAERPELYELQLIEPLEHEEPLHIVGPAESLDLVDPAEPLDFGAPVEPSDLVEPVEPLELVELVEPLDLVDPVEPLELVESVEPLDLVEPVEPLDLVESVEPLDLVAPVEPLHLIHEDPVREDLVHEDLVREDPVRSRALLTIAALNQWLAAIHAAGFERHP